MRCSCCNVILTPQESTRKFKTSGDYVDMCNKCLTTIDDDVEYTDGYQGEDEYNDYKDDDGDYIYENPNTIDHRRNKQAAICGRRMVARERDRQLEEQWEREQARNREVTEGDK